MEFFADIASAGLMWILTIVWGGTIAGWLLGAERNSWRKRIGFGAPLGMGLIAWTGFVCSLSGINAGSRIPVVLCLLMAAVTGGVGLRQGTWRTRQSAKPVEESWPIIWAQQFLMAICCVPLLAILIQGLSQPLSNIDGLAIWNFKAKILAAEPVITSATLRDPSLSYSHEDYPLLVPFQIAMVWSLRGVTSDRSAAVWHAGLAILYALLIYDCCRRRLSDVQSLLLTAVVCAMPLFTTQAAGNLADIALMMTWLAAIVAWLEALETKRSGDLILSGLCTAAMVFVKQEGLALAGVLAAFVLGLTVLRRITVSSSLAWLASFVLPNLAWWIFSRQLPQTHENYAGRLTLENLTEGLSRLPAIATYFAERMCDWRATNGFWLLLMLAILLALFLRPPLKTWLPGGLLLGQLFAYVVAFLLTPWDLQTLLAMKTDALLLTATPAAIVLLIEILSTFEREQPASLGRPQPGRSSAKNTKHGARSFATWSSNVLSWALCAAGLLSLPEVLWHLPRHSLARLSQADPGNPQLLLRAQLQGIIAHMPTAGDVRLRCEIPADPRVGVAMTRSSELVYYFGTYELFPRRLRATDKPAVINDGRDLLEAQLRASETWSADQHLSAELQLRFVPGQGMALAWQPLAPQKHPDDREPK